MRRLLGALHAGILVVATGMALAAEPVPAPVPGGGWLPPPTPAPVPKLPGEGAPLGKVLAPPVTPATEAYLFRTRLSSAALCQRFVTQADVVFLDERTDIPTKAAMLGKIETEAKMYNCVTPE